MTGEHAQPGDSAESSSRHLDQPPTVLRRTAAGWSVGDEDVPDLTCAMVLADLIAAELPDDSPESPGRQPAAGASAVDAGLPAGGKAAGQAAGAGMISGAGSAARADPASEPAAGAGAGAGAGAAGAGPGGDSSHDEAGRLRLTISQLERALAVRIRVEQAIGVLAERHRVRPRQAFEQLRSVARRRGQRVIDVAGDVIASATNPLLPLPEELSRPNLAPRQRGGSRRRARESQ
jgi:ANTAR domain